MLQNRNRGTSIAPRIWLFSIAGFILFYNLANTPAFFFDEGIFGQVAKNTIEHGVYANRVSEEFIPTHLSVGPTVLLPVAATYAIAGVGIWQTRLVVGIAGLLTLLLYYQLHVRQYNQATALFSTSLVLSFLFAEHRQLYGEIPAIGFLLAGIWCWYRAMRHDSSVSAMCAGLALGAMVVCKPQFLLVGAAFLGAFIANWFYYRCWSVRVFTWMALMFPIPLVLSLAYQIGMLNWHTYWSHTLYELNTTSGVSVFSSEIGSFFATNHFHTRKFELFLGLVFLFVSVKDCRERNVRGLVTCTLLLLAIISLVWYTLISPGWSRYGILGYALLYGFSSARILEAIRFAQKRVEERYTAESVRNLAIIRFVPSLSVLFLMLPRILHALPEIVVIVCFPLIISYHLVIAPAQNDDLLALSTTIENVVPPGKRIESYEWTLDVLTTGRHYHHPSLEVRNTHVRYYVLHQGSPPPVYAFWHYHPDFLVSGPMAGNAAYPYDYLDQCAEHLVTHGEYTLYQLQGAECFEQVSQGHFL